MTPGRRRGGRPPRLRHVARHERLDARGDGRRGAATSVPRVKRRLVRLLQRAGLLGPAFRLYERLIALRPQRVTPTDGGPELPPRRLMVRVAGTADADWFLRSGRAGYDAIAAHVPLDDLGSVLDF